MKNPEIIKKLAFLADRQIVILAHNIRSTHNVGAILRTAEGFGIREVIFSGYTPFPKIENDPRLPFIAEKLHKQISKTALGAEEIVKISISESIQSTINQLKKSGFMIAALEQTSDSVALQDFSPPEKIALLLGEEVHGVEQDLLDLCDQKLEIPMFGQKESFNVSVAAGIAMFCLRLN